MLPIAAQLFFSKGTAVSLSNCIFLLIGILSLCLRLLKILWRNPSLGKLSWTKIQGLISLCLLTIGWLLSIERLWKFRNMVQRNFSLDKEINSITDHQLLFFRFQWILLCFEGLELVKQVVVKVLELVKQVAVKVLELVKQVVVKVLELVQGLGSV